MENPTTPTALGRQRSGHRRHLHWRRVRAGHGLAEYISQIGLNYTIDPRALTINGNFTISHQRYDTILTFNSEGRLIHKSQ